MLEIVWASSAATRYDRLPGEVRARVDLALYRLAVLGQGDVVRMQGKAEPEYRLRVGEYRVRFATPLGAGHLIVLYVGPRGDAYRE